ncbi:MAG: flippase-like domain-containing protein [Steroidobacteraceae bacterium]
MRTLARIVFALGLAAVVALVVHEGAQSIVDLLKRAGWVLLLLVPLHALPLLLDVMGWHVLLHGRVRVPVLFLIASIREAINRLLPVANIGGEVVGVHLLIRQGVSGTMAAASVIVEVLLILVAQYLFLTLGVACLLSLTGGIQTLAGLLMAFAAALPVVLLFMWSFRSGAFFRAIKRLAAGILRSNGNAPSILDKLADLDTAIRELTAAHRRLARAIAWQLAGLIGGSSETWLALRWLGHPSGLAAALALESLTLAARSLIFVAPAGLGVQEAGLIGVGHVLGITSDVAIALSLAKRMREIVFGLPALAAWQWTMRARAR